MEREEELEQTIDELNYRLTNALRKIDSLKSNIKQAREEIKGLSQFGLLIEKSEVLDIIDKLIESEEE